MIDCSGSFDSISTPDQYMVKVLVATYHLRNGTKNIDGSMGTIRISPGQLRELLAYCIGEVRFPHSVKSGG